MRYSTWRRRWTTYGCGFTGSASGLISAFFSSSSRIGRKIAIRGTPSAALVEGGSFKELSCFQGYLVLAVMKLLNVKARLLLDLSLAKVHKFHHSYALQSSRSKNVLLVVWVLAQVFRVIRTQKIQSVNFLFIFAERILVHRLLCRFLFYIIQHKRTSCCIYLSEKDRKHFDSWFFFCWVGEEVEQIRRSSHSFENLKLPERKICLSGPNKLSEELIRLTVNIFHKLNKTTDAAELEMSSTSKLNISCIGPRSLVPKSSAITGAAISTLKNRRMSQGGDGAEKEIGCHKRFVEFTKSSFDVSRISSCLVDIKNLRWAITPFFVAVQ